MRAISFLEALVKIVATFTLFLLLLLSHSLLAQSGASAPLPLAKSPTPNAAPKIDPGKEADIRQLLDVGGSRAAMTAMISSMEENTKPLLRNALPPGEYRAQLVELFFEKFRSKLDLQTMLDLAVPVYDKYLSDEEIKDLTAFYSTPLGQKVVKVLPQVLTECSEAGRKWGEELGRESMTEVLSEHPDLKKALEEAARPPLPK